MKEKISRALRIAVIMTVLTALIPIIAAAAFSLRYLVFLLVPLGIILFFLVPSLRRFLAEPEETWCIADGFRLPPGYAIHPHHSWARPAGTRRALVGVDDFLQKILGPVEDVVLPRVGETMRKGQPLASLSSEGRTLSVSSPVEGTVGRVNGKVRDDPGLINREPYGGGWIATLDSKNAEADLSGLPVSQSAFAWYRAEVDRLKSLLSSNAELSQLMQDGGDVAEDLAGAIDDTTWERIRKEFFGR